MSVYVLLVCLRLVWWPCREKAVQLELFPGSTSFPFDVMGGVWNLIESVNETAMIRN